MSYTANVYQVIIASPGDVPRERQLAREIIIEWNSVNSKFKKICLLPVGWEHDSTPEMGNRGQEFINKQILEESDLLIGIFWTKIGSPTGDSISGSVEEIEKHVESGKPAMLYFSNAPVMPDSIDQEQYAKLKEFKEECFKKGLVETFDSIEDFRSKLTRQLALKINQHEHFQINEDQTFDDLNYETADEQKDLTDTEKLLIIEMSNDPEGIVMKIVTKSGFQVQTNGKSLDTEQTPRSRALWDETFRTLLNKDLIEERGYKGEVFALTLNGYKQADILHEVQ